MDKQRWWNDDHPNKRYFCPVVHCYRVVAELEFEINGCANQSAGVHYAFLRVHKKDLAGKKEGEGRN